MKIKRILRRLAAVFIAFALPLCASCTAPAKDSARLSIVCTIYPQYAFASEIAGGLADVKMLLSPGAEAHGFEPTVRDLSEIFSSDLFIYCSGESEEWVDSSMADIKKSRTTVLDIRDGLELISTDGEHDEHDGHDHHHDGFDEHVWTSPKNAAEICGNILEAMSAADPDNAASYRKNAEKIEARLAASDARLTALAEKAENKVLIFADRFPFAYLAHDYGFEHFAAFNGCSSSTEISVAVVSRLCENVRKNSAKNVFFTETSDGRIAQTVANSTGAKPVRLHSQHNLSKSEFKEGLTFCDIMDENVTILEEAFL